MIYIIDHQDSFTWNVVHQFAKFDKVICANYFEVNFALMQHHNYALSDIEKPRITVATRDIQISNSAFLELSIEDNGIGFTEETVSKVFEPYVSTKPKGKGLGLAIVKNIYLMKSEIIIFLYTYYLSL